MRNSSNNGNSEITQEPSQPQESQLSKFKNQYRSTLNYFLARQTEREDIIKVLPHTLEIIDTLADKLLDPNKKIEFKELSKLTTKELTEIKTSLEIIDQRNDRPQAPTFDAVKNKCTEIIDTLITNKEETKKNRNFLFSAVRKFSRFMGRSQTSDLNEKASLTIDQKFTDIKNILAPQNESVRKATDEQIANILKDNIDKLRNLNVVGAQNSGGNSSGGGSLKSVDVNLTFADPKAKPINSPAKSEPDATLAGPTLTTQQKTIEDALKNLNAVKSMPSTCPPAAGLPTLTRRVGSLPQRKGEPSTSPSSPQRVQSLTDRVIARLGPDSPEGQRLENTTRNLIELRRKQEELRKQKSERRINGVRQPGNGNGGERT